MPVESLSLGLRLIIVFVVCGFMPLAAVSFLGVRLRKKRQDYEKNLKTFGIPKSRDLTEVYSGRHYFLPLLFVTLICILGATSFVFADIIFADLIDGQLPNGDTLLLSTTYFGDPNNAGIQVQSLVVMSFAFIGSFLWSSGIIIVRLINNDLPPNVFFSAGIRMLMAAVIALVLSLILGSETDSSLLNLKASLPWIALGTGMFPDRILNYLVERYKIFSNGNNINTTVLALDNIEGISLGHKERLAEEGIDNAQNLATASLIEMLIKTPYEARQLLDWIGQAKLLCYLKDDIQKARSLGIRTVYDFFNGNKSQEALREMADAVQMERPILQVVCEQVQSDPGIRALADFQNKLNSKTPDQQGDLEAHNKPNSPLGS